MNADGTPIIDPVVAFYRLEAPDARGRMLHDIWRWDSARLETVHDYIQWLFPLDVPSAFNPAAPLLTAGVIVAFREDSTLRDRLTRSLELMLTFYGLFLRWDGDGTPRVIERDDFDAIAAHWLRPGDHNHLRLTRILASLRILGLQALSVALFERLLQIRAGRPESISEVTVEYWRAACRGGAMA